MQTDTHTDRQNVQNHHKVKWRARALMRESENERLDGRNIGE